MFDKARDYEAFEEALAETLAKVPLRVCGFWAAEKVSGMLCRKPLILVASLRGAQVGCPEFLERIAIGICGHDTSEALQGSFSTEHVRNQMRSERSRG